LVARVGRCPWAWELGKPSLYELSAGLPFAVGWLVLGKELRLGLTGLSTRWVGADPDLLTADTYLHAPAVFALDDAH
ncbi:MAG: hypothetical protein WCO31_07765, partial [Actinomycetes bacterium]